MNWNRVAIILSALNFALLIGLAAQSRPVAAASEVAPVLRGRALELVDDKGRLRAEMKIFPAAPNVKMPDGTIGYPEAVQLRLIDSTGSRARAREVKCECRAPSDQNLVPSA